MRGSQFAPLGVVAVLFTVAVTLAVLVNGDFGWLAAVIGVFVIIGVIDFVQIRHSVRRNYPLFGRLRWIGEEFRPEIQQYFVEQDTEGRPFDRTHRSLVYQRAKDMHGEQPFGTQLDVYASGYEWFSHSLAPKPQYDGQFRVRLEGKGVDKPYDMSLLNVSAMSFGSLSSNAIVALNEGAKRGGFAHDTGEGGLSDHHKRGGDLVWEIGTGYFGTRTVVMDMRGFGMSEKPLDGDYQSDFTLLLQADLYDALADHLGLKTVLLVAHDMGQTVGLELMARFEEGRTPFRIRHAILLDGSTLIDMIKPTPYQQQALAAPSTALPDDMDWQDIYNIFPESYSTESQARDDFAELVICQSHQIHINHGSRTIGGIVHYLKERKENFGRWSRTLFDFKKAPLTVIWGEQDPVAVIAMADRIKRERPVTDLYKYPDSGHWPSIEFPNRIGDAIIARLGSL